MQTHQEIRQTFLDFFKQKGHTIIPSSKIFLQEDPTLLFVNAGMNQFKNIFMGNQNPAYKRAANSQKCLRVSGKHNDLDDVGVDHYHHTFFEMLGSWSFADYTKDNAIIWAWELMTEIYKLDKNKLWATVYETDQEAADIWKNLTDIDTSRILFCGKKDNFWTMGNIGPCGPASEIHYDLGEDSCDMKGKEHKCSVNGDCGRYIELWNLVFMEFEQKEDGSEIPLPNKYIDTGMGLERIVRVLQNKNSNYDTDIFTPILSKIEELCGKIYLDCREQDQIAFRVVADHIRALCFAIADGILPSNTGRGYVIRRVLRRAYRYGKILGMPTVFLAPLVSTLVNTMGDAFPELRTAQAEIIKVIKDEEERFDKTLETGLSLFEKEIQKVQGKIIPGTLAFLLFDTYGFPVDLTSILAKEKGYTVDIPAFEVELEKQKKLSQENQKFKDKKTTDGFTILDENIKATQFVGYENLVFEGSKIIKYHQEGELFQIVLDKTPFYAEGGGQVADTGILYSSNFSMYVEDVQKTPKEYIHYGYIEGTFQANDSISTKVEKERRFALKRHHTGVHMLHAALMKVLQKPIEFNSTYVAEDYFYADVIHNQKFTEEELRSIEEEMNRSIQSCYPIVTHLHNTLEEVDTDVNSRFKDRLADKDVTRVVEITHITTDLCGGTHASNTGELGLFKILADVSAGSSLRHLECVCGLKAWSIFNQMYDECKEISYEVKSSVKEVPRRAFELLEESKQMKKDIKQLQTQLAQYKYTISHIKQVGTTKDIPFYMANFEDATMPDLKRLAMEFTSQNPNSVVFLHNTGDSHLYILSCNEETLSKGLDIQAIHKTLVETLSAKGGGKGTTFNGSFQAKIDDTLQVKLINSLKAL